MFSSSPSAPKVTLLTLRLNSLLLALPLQLFSSMFSSRASAPKPSPLTLARLQLLASDFSSPYTLEASPIILITLCYTLPMLMP